MSLATISSDFLTDLSDEQQSLVTGGGQLVDLRERDYTDFEYQNVYLEKNIGSGFNGSFINKRLNTDFIFTSAYEELDLEFD